MKTGEMCYNVHGFIFSQSFVLTCLYNSSKGIFFCPQVTQTTIKSVPKLETFKYIVKLIKAFVAYAAKLSV